MVFKATVIARLLSFIASWIALQLIPNKELGIVIYAFQIITFIIPVAGLGLHQGLIRYGALLQSKEDKNSLFNYAFKKGILVSFGLIILTISSSYLFGFQESTTRFYLILLSLAIVTHYILELIKIQFRLHKDNRSYAYVEIAFNIALVLLVFGLSYFFKELGYAIALVICPLIISLFFLKKLKIDWNKNTKLSIIDGEFWRYGFFASMSNVTTQLLVAIDIILIGNILKNMEMVTAFKYVSLIPYSLIFLSQVVINTDFVEFTEKINDKKYIKKYIKNYMLLFLCISAGILGFIGIFGERLLSLFDKTYIQYTDSLMILTVGITGILIVRGLFGNLLSSIGKAYLNFVVTVIALVLNIVLNYQLIPEFGIFGAASTSAVIMWFTAILCMLFFWYHFKKSTSDN